MALLQWKTIEIEKTLGTKRLKGAEWLQSPEAREKGIIADDGKTHTVRTGVQKIPMTYPELDPKSVSDPLDIAQALTEILNAQIDGYKALRVLVDHLNYGLYNNVRSTLSKGVDLRYSALQRNAIKAYRGLVAGGAIERHVAVEQLLRQGITDAEEQLDMGEQAEPVAEPEGESLNGV